MEDNPENPYPPTVLVAYATATLVDGASFELLPFLDEYDVKSKFTSLLESWAESGFLLRGQRVYPWHQVRHVEVSRVVEMSEQDAHQRILDWEKAEFSEQQHNFWRMKRSMEKADEKSEGNQPSSHP
ncbi:MAG: hypothetical protein HIU93_03160 [Acidobacteria bacterium]|nr:hypothetical protein [Acidobacteriota bacterium]MBW4044489.1 hypothetical protein [Acidobacteriota bacterium]